MKIKKITELSKESLFVNISKLVANQSKCKRNKVGAIIVSPDLTNIIGIGYNGTPYGFPNDCECDHNNTTYDYVIHAEQNALMKLAKSGNSSDGAVMYCTLSPCQKCAALMIQAGIKKVVFTEKYRDDSGIKLLEQANIEVIQVID